MALKRAVLLVSQFNLNSFVMDTTSQLEGFRHDGHTLGVDRAHVGSLKDRPSSLPAGP